MIKHGGQNLGFMFNKPGYDECINCRHMNKFTCFVQNINPAVGELKDHSCSNFRWSFIKLIKGSFKHKLNLHTKSFHIRNIMSNTFNNSVNEYLKNEYGYQLRKDKK